MNRLTYSSCNTWTTQSAGPPEDDRRAMQQPEPNGASPPRTAPKQDPTVGGVQQRPWPAASGTGLARGGSLLPQQSGGSAGCTRAFLFCRPHRRQGGARRRRHPHHQSPVSPAQTASTKAGCDTYRPGNGHQNGRDGGHGELGGGGGRGVHGASGPRRPSRRRACSLKRLLSTPPAPGFIHGHPRPPSHASNQTLPPPEPLLPLAQPPAGGWQPQLGLPAPRLPGK